MNLGGQICIRQLSSTEEVVEVGKGMVKRYKQQPVLPFHSKSIAVFQKIDGVDVIVFVLYVHEFDGNCPYPNKNTVYISYLDSVKYLQPASLSTFLYHELMISYLDFARLNGISKAVIWSCPPQAGDDYILNAKASTQKIPGRNRLLLWYQTMLDECQRRGICTRVTTAYDHYLCDPSVTATDLPYFKDDYFSRKIEEIVAGNMPKRDEGSHRDEVILKLAEDLVQSKGKDNIIIAFLASDGKFEMKAEEDAGCEDINGVFDYRECFLELCKEKNYQFNNLQRAKHSSMMILYCVLGGDTR